jgi:hypothetical protein
MERIAFIGGYSCRGNKNIKMKTHLKTIGIIFLAILFFLSFGKIWQIYDPTINYFIGCIFALLFICGGLAIIIWLIIIYCYIYNYFNEKNIKK